MAVGIQQSAGDINAWAGRIALEIEQVMVQIQHFKAFLDATTDTALEAAPYSFSTGDVANLRSAFTDLNTLANVYFGSGTQASAYDFRTFTKLLRGVSCW